MTPGELLIVATFVGIEEPRAKAFIQVLDFIRGLEAPSQPSSDPTLDLVAQVAELRERCEFDEEQMRQLRADSERATSMLRADRERVTGVVLAARAAVCPLDTPPDEPLRSALAKLTEALSEYDNYIPF